MRGKVMYYAYITILEHNELKRHLIAFKRVDDRMHYLQKVHSIEMPACSLASGSPICNTIKKKQ